MQERYLIKRLLSNNIKVVAVAGNDGVDLSKSCITYPACSSIKDKNFFVVASYKDKIRNIGSNYNGPVTSKEEGNMVSIAGYTMSGTSMAAAIKSGKLGRELEK